MGNLAVASKAGGLGHATTHDIVLRFNVTRLPENLEAYSHKKVKEATLVNGTLGDIRGKRVKVHLADEGDQKHLTMDSDEGHFTRQNEIHLSPTQFRAFWEMVEHPAFAGKIENITRYYIPHGDSTILLDIHDGEIGMRIATVSFSSEEEMAKFQADMPSWLGSEVRRIHHVTEAGIADLLRNGSANADLLGGPVRN